jgi:lipopolysaccharide/colanic/teichoic acid biosynthesis glycosyltransferase
MKELLEKAVADPPWRGVAAKAPRWKRLFDLVVLTLCLPFLLPVVLLIVLGIMIVSPGPVLFCQERIGFMGRKFKCWKFRSMKVGVECKLHREHATQLMRSRRPWSKLDKSGDPRLVPLGSLLRASGLDELPQLISVLRGEMSLVGPRPCTPYEFDEYLPWQKERFEALPGLTGLWQVSDRNKTTFTDMIHLDIHYVRHMSLWQDVKIISKTVPFLLSQLTDVIRKSVEFPRKSTAQKQH